MRLALFITLLGVLFSACTPKSDEALCKTTLIKEPQDLKNQTQWSPLGKEE